MMEAVWIRFFPIMLEIKELLHTKRVLGKILRAQSEFSMTMPTDPAHRLNNPDLAGGALLDMGIYPLTWQLNLIFEDPDNKGVEPEVTSSMIKGPTGVDAYTTMLMNWPQLGIQTVATCNVRVPFLCVSAPPPLTQLSPTTGSGEVAQGVLHPRSGRKGRSDCRVGTLPTHELRAPPQGRQGPVHGTTGQRASHSRPRHVLGGRRLCTSVEGRQKGGRSLPAV